MLRRLPQAAESFGYPLVNAVDLQRNFAEEGDVLTLPPVATRRAQCFTSSKLR